MTIAIIASFISDAFVVAGLIGIFVKGFKWLKKLEEGEKCQLRTQMLNIYYKNTDKIIDQYEYESFNYCYQAYKALGGNSFIDKIKNEIEGWDIQPRS